MAALAAGQGEVCAPSGNATTAGANLSPCTCAQALRVPAVPTALVLSRVELPWDHADRLSQLFSVEETSQRSQTFTEPP